MATQQQVKDAILRADEYINKLYRMPPLWTDKAVMSEYPSIPYWQTETITCVISEKFQLGNRCIMKNAQGQWVQSDVYGKIKNTTYDDGTRWEGNIGFVKTVGSDWERPEFNTIFRPHPDNNVVMQCVTNITKPSSPPNYDLYFGVVKLIDDPHYPDVASISTDQYPSQPASYGCFPSSRYTVRHGLMLGHHHYMNDSSVSDWATRRDRLIVIPNALNYTMDVYKPNYNNSNNYNDGFFFQNECYPDKEFWDNYAVKQYTSNHAYPYFSGFVENRPTKLSNSRWWRHINCLQATHILQKYQNLNQQDTYGNKPLDYLRYGYIRDGQKGTAVETYWVDGVGLVDGAGYCYAPDLGCFIIAESDAGYGFGNTFSKAFADKAVDVMISVQWKGDGTDYSYPNGQIRRPDHRGGFITSWVSGSLMHKVPPSGQPPPVGVYMGVEMPARTPTNVESALICERALRVYYWYKWASGSGAFPCSLRSLW